MAEPKHVDVGAEKPWGFCLVLLWEGDDLCRLARIWWSQHGSVWWRIFGKTLQNLVPTQVWPMTSTVALTLKKSHSIVRFTG